METIYTKPMDYLEMLRMSYDPSISPIIVILNDFLQENNACETCDFNLSGRNGGFSHRHGPTRKKLETAIFLFTDYLQRVCEPLFDLMPVSQQIERQLYVSDEYDKDLSRLVATTERMKSLPKNEEFTSIIEQLEKMFSLCKYAKMKVDMYELNCNIQRTEEKWSGIEKEVIACRIRERKDLDDKIREFKTASFDTDELRKRYKEDSVT